MRLGQLVLISLASLLVACGSTFVYKKAEGPDVATIRITNQSGKWLRAMESHKGDCTDMWFFGNSQESINPSETRSTTAKPGTFLVLNIVGNITMSAGSISSCPFNVGFTTEPSTEYELNYRNSNDGCGLTASARTRDGLRPVPLTPMSLRNAIGPQSCAKVGQ